MLAEPEGSKPLVAVVAPWLLFITVPTDNVANSKADIVSAPFAKFVAVEPVTYLKLLPVVPTVCAVNLTVLAEAYAITPNVLVKVLTLAVMFVAVAVAVEPVVT